MRIGHNIFLTLSLLAGFAVASCQVDELIDMTPPSVDLYDGLLEEVRIEVVVNELNVDVSTRGDAEVSDYKELATEAEKKVSDMWVFQYDSATEKLLTYGYYTVTNQEDLNDFPVKLASGYSSYIYIVTNTRDSYWVTDSNYNEFGTIDLLREQALPDPFPIIFDGGTEDNPIPMEGMTETPVTPGVTREIIVPVTRMYAKVEAKVVFADILKYYYSDVEVNYIDFRNIPEYCRVGSLAESQRDEEQVAFPSETVFAQRALNKADGVGDEDDENYYPYVIYVPENLGGEGSNTKNTPSKKVDEAPEGAMNVRVRINYKELEGSSTSTNIYTTYPGGNSYNNYNIRRNCVYRLTINIGYPLEATINGSANTFVGMEGELLSFYPYFREEHGGGYDISTYLDSTDPEKTIDRVEIIWQDKDCIGDNSKGDLVWIEYDEEETDPTLNYHVYVQTNKEGNALIGAYNSAGTIIWSWLIWVRDPQYGDPTNLGNAMLYYTYDWDENGIKADSPRISGYPIMSCNLGAMQDEPEYTKNSGFGTVQTPDISTPIQPLVDGDCIARTYGLLFQWGRKDPFPPMIVTGGAIGSGKANANAGYYIHDYDDAHTGSHYANDNSTVVHKTAYDENGPTYDGATKYDSYLFHTHLAESGEGVQYSINNPTVFLSGVYNIAYCLGYAFDNGADKTDYVKDINSYVYRGAWSEEDEDDKEWGAVEITSSTKRYDTQLNTDAGGTVILYDNYGDEKSIFDPCPYGWRVPPGELWLGFTKNGLNAYNDPLFQNTDTDSDDSLGSFDNINFDLSKSCMLGMSIYLGPTWRTGLTSWFPTQGFRLPDGCGYRVGGCGNYANANADNEGAYDRINALHVHGRVINFKAFESQVQYTAKSSANPIRCVRDTK